MMAQDAIVAKVMVMKFRHIKRGVSYDAKTVLFHVLTLTTVFIVTLSSWATHVITCIQSEEWGFLIAGAIAFPIGIVHGVGIWFGAW